MSSRDDLVMLYGYGNDLQERSKTAFKVDNMIRLANVNLVRTHKGRCAKLGNLCSTPCFQGFYVKASREHIWSYLDATMGEIFVEKVLAIRVKIALRQKPLDCFVNTPP